MKCKICGKTLYPANMYSKTKCLECYAEYHRKWRSEHIEENREYHREYMACKRWLNGGPDNRLLGEKIEIKMRSVNGVLYI